MIPLVLFNFSLCFHLYAHIMRSAAEWDGLYTQHPPSSVRLPCVLFPGVVLTVGNLYTAKPCIRR